ncbi:glycogen synthase [Chlamydiifrater volucris]|uniref:glycogen synthase n=1 Tax=Chlamydiifrater volucris TaxID=2681470 RepID=UPI001BCBCA52|nr:glycogen/starch synthase [Chlamydiifrater volucris]
MRIIHVSAEVAHFAKVGGLGDVVHDLANTFSRNHDVEVVIPFYERLCKTNSNLNKILDFKFFFEKEHTASAIQTQKDSIAITFIRTNYRNFFDRDNIYGFSDDPQRFACFCSAAAEYIYQQSLTTRIHVVHLHDWHAALTAGLLKDKKNFNSKIVFTIHNFSHRGYFPLSSMRKTSLSPKTLQVYQLERDPNSGCLMRGGILLSHAITTVSPGYSKEMLEDRSDEDISRALINSQDKFQGILNGINVSYWNPETDNLIHQKYPSNPEKIQQIISGKSRNKSFLLKTLGLPQNSDPLVCVISRLVHQKGLSFMLQAVEHAEKESYKIILLGQCGDDHSKKIMEEARNKIQGSERIFMRLEYDEPLAHLVYAGADIILIPSLFEPCGLTQLIGMRYGTVPIVRKTGGLRDTVTNLENGFVFSEANDPNEFLNTLKEALRTYRDHFPLWKKLIRQGISSDYSWKKSEISYLSIYSDS